MNNGNTGETGICYEKQTLGVFAQASAITTSQVAKSCLYGTVTQVTKLIFSVCYFEYVQTNAKHYLLARRPLSGSKYSLTSRAVIFVRYLYSDLHQGNHCATDDPYHYYVSETLILKDIRIADFNIYMGSCRYLQRFFYVKQFFSFVSN